MAKSGSTGINTVIVTLATSVAVLITSNIFLFILGCICGHCLCKKLANRDTHPSLAYKIDRMSTLLCGIV